MAEAIAAAAKALMKKLAVDLALDKDKRNKFLDLSAEMSIIN